ncbi:MAG: hypothetical protein AB1505_32350 [Candidatus Latescibacterota bacterium]
MNSISGTTAGMASAAALVERVAGRTGGAARAWLSAAPAATAADQTEVGARLQAGLADAATRAREAQEAIAAAQGTEASARQTQARLREMRDLARRAADTRLGEEDRSALSARFAELQTRVNEGAGAAAAPGGTLADALARPAEDAGTRGGPRIAVSGRARLAGELLEERGAALADSRVARARGLGSVEVDRLEGPVILRFTDTGNAQVTATRFAQTAQGLVETATQTVAAPGALQGGTAGGTLRFDRLGVELGLEEGYTAGGLHGLEVAVTPAAEPEPAAADEDQALLDLSVEDAASAAAAVGRLDELMARAGALRQEMRQEQERLGASLARALGSLGGTPAEPGALGAGAATSLQASLRRQLLEQTAEGLRAQGGVAPASVLRLVGP